MLNVPACCAAWVTQSLNNFCAAILVSSVLGMKCNSKCSALVRLSATVPLHFAAILLGFAQHVASRIMRMPAVTVMSLSASKNRVAQKSE